MHADLSAFNLLWWDGHLKFIDFPQSVDLAINPNGLDFLHRDIENVTGWFERHGVTLDAESLFADLLNIAYPPRRSLVVVPDIPDEIMRGAQRSGCRRRRRLSRPVTGLFVFTAAYLAARGTCATPDAATAPTAGTSGKAER